MSLIQSIGLKSTAELFPDRALASGPTRILRINNVRRVNRDLGKHSYFLVEPASGFGSNRCPTMLMKIMCGLDLRCRRGEFSSMGDADGDAPCSQDLCYEAFGTNAIRLLRLPIGRFNVPLSRVWVSV
ncbi:MAG TPA: hypothetical protein VNZ53_55910 [Steroidobacteraceae bacterium]|nr:hypothetical protein [Steroidobacteraceae bacterium]